MEHLNEYLQQLVSTNGEALYLEPDKNPYVSAPSGDVNVAESPLQGAQINSMVFALIPEDVKQELPNQQEVNFNHPHNLGNFSFSVKKSPLGFNVVITIGEAQQPQSDSPEPETASSPPSAVSSDIPGITPPPNDFNNFAPASTDEASQSEPGQYVADQSSDIGEIEVEYVDVEKPAEEALSQVQPEISMPEEVEVPSKMDPAPAQPQVEIFQSAQPEPKQFPAIDDAPQLVQHIEMPSVPAVSERPKLTATNPQARSKMDELFKKMAGIGASDLHLSVSVPPMIRKDGKMVLLEEGQPELTADSMKDLLTSIMPQKNLDEFAERNDTDFAYEIKGLARFRSNIFMDRKGMGGVFRIIPSEIMTAEDLSLSEHILDLCRLSKGLVVVTGPTGSGKSTTLCAMVDYINRDREDHIITIEDPIEFVHDNKKCLVNQREVHNHTDSFKDALRAALREDPDILLVGEMRDLETISIAIETAETGHLVFGTLHTTTAASTVDRIIDQFPADRQQQIRVMLSESLKGVIAQTLLPKKGGGRVAALEVLIVSPAVSNLIREGKTFQIPSAMQTGKNQGMVMLNDALIDLCKEGIVEPKDAYIKSVDKEGFQALLSRNGLKM